jgi:hypothetical protein
MSNSPHARRLDVDQIDQIVVGLAMFTQTTSTERKEIAAAMETRLLPADESDESFEERWAALGQLRSALKKLEAAIPPVRRPSERKNLLG